MSRCPTGCRATTETDVSKLFIALSAMGNMRFIGEVDRGADCGCVCPVCGSPLVARQGMSNDWHFAHDAAHEGPECGAADLRMLRRFVIEYLRAHMQAADFVLPAYRQEVTLTRSLVGFADAAAGVSCAAAVGTSAAGAALVELGNSAFATTTGVVAAAALTALSTATGVGAWAICH